MTKAPETGNEAETVDASISSNIFTKERSLHAVFLGLAGLALTVLFVVSVRLAGMRIFQVDEGCNVFVATILARDDVLWRSEGFATTFFQLLLGWLDRGSAKAIDLFLSARLLMLMIFWLNVLLLATATGERFLSRRWLIATIGASTLAPLWDYGFEIRHDNLLLSGLLMTWCVLRTQPDKVATYFVLGFASVGLEFIAIKSFVYAIPISLLVLAIPPCGNTISRRRILSWWLLGAVTALVFMRLAFGLSGFWSCFMNLFGGLAAVPGSALRFWPWDFTLPRLLTQTPFLLAVAVGALAATLSSAFKSWQAVLRWDGITPEVVLLGIASAALFLNPNPYPYNLLHFVPYAFLLAFRYGARLWDQLLQRNALLPLVAATAIFAHFVPFVIATQRHFSRTNSRQELLMTLAERLTDPAKDPVYDAIGMVPTRPIVHMQTFIHGQTIGRLINSGGPQIRDYLAARPPAVIIPSYRTDWLPEIDQEFIRSRYVRLADDFMVLGAKLPKGGGTFEIHHPGRYWVGPQRLSNLEGSYFAPRSLNDYFSSKMAQTEQEPVPHLNGTLDGNPIPNGPVELTVGSHQVQCGPEGEHAVVWLGPSLNQPPRLGHGDRLKLFMNWY